MPEQLEKNPGQNRHENQSYDDLPWWQIPQRHIERTSDLRPRPDPLLWDNSCLKRRCSFEVDPISTKFSQLRRPKSTLSTCLRRPKAAQFYLLVTFRDLFALRTPKPGKQFRSTDAWSASLKMGMQIVTRPNYVFGNMRRGARSACR